MCRRCADVPAAYDLCLITGSRFIGAPVCCALSVYSDLRTYDMMRYSTNQHCYGILAHPLSAFLCFLCIIFSLLAFLHLSLQLLHPSFSSSRRESYLSHTSLLLLSLLVCSPICSFSHFSPPALFFFLPPSFSIFSSPAQPLYHPPLFFYVFACSVSSISFSHLFYSLSLLHLPSPLSGANSFLS